MIEVLKFKNKYMFKRIPTEIQCKCDKCERIIYRKNPDPAVEDIESLENIKKVYDQYYKDNPMNVVYYEVSTDSLTTFVYCNDCVMDATKNMLKLSGEAKIERKNTPCFYTEIKEDK